MQMRKLWAERVLIESGHRVVAVGRSFAKTVANYFPTHRDRIRWCFAGGPPPRPAEAPRTPGDRVRLLLIGRPTPQKGWDHLAGALHAIERDAPADADTIEVRVLGGLGNWRGPLTDYGSGVLGALEALRRIRFVNLGRMSFDDTQRAYRDADAFVLPSAYEPFGLVLVEAMAAGLPILASDADGPADVVEPAFGRLVPRAPAETHVARLAEALLAFTRLPPDERTRMGEAARLASTRYTWDACAERLLAFTAEATQAARF